MHEILTNHPEYQAALAAGRKVRARSSRLASVTAKRRAEHQAALLRYHDAVREALDSGSTPPDPPTAPVEDPELARTLAQEAVLADRPEQAIYTALAPELLPLLERRAAELEQTAREAADILAATAAESSRLRATGERLRRSSGRLGLLDSGPVDPAGLLRLVADGRGLLDSADPRPSASDAAGHSFATASPSQPARLFRDMRLEGRR